MESFCLRLSPSVRSGEVRPKDIHLSLRREAPLPLLAEPRHALLEPRVLVLDHLLSHRIRRYVVVVEHCREPILDPAPGLAAEEVGELDWSAVRRVLRDHGLGPT